MRFSKYQVAGNDFLIVKEEVNEQLIKAICHRQFGVGADGIITYVKKKMTYYNCDGSNVAINGNALGCLLKYLFDTQGITYFASGETYARYFDRAHVVVNLGKALLNSVDLPVVADVLNYQLTVLDKVFPLTSIVIGNIHSVYFCNDINSIEKYGPLLANNPIYPNGSNITFAHKINKDQVQIKTFERGCGFTNSCASGIAAVAAILYRKKEINDKVEIITTEANRVSIHQDEIDIIIKPRFVLKGVFNNDCH